MELSFMAHPGSLSSVTGRSIYHEGRRVGVCGKGFQMVSQSNAGLELPSLT